MQRKESLRYSLKQLEVFMAVAAHGTTAAAAEHLALSQSATSSALNTLERSYNVQLFERVGKRLVLSAMGHRLLEQADALLSHARELESSLLGHSMIGDLNIGASYTIANHLTVDYITQWLERHPDARIDVATGNSPDIVSRVLDAEVDLGMIENEAGHPELELIPWLHDELLVFASPTHPLANKAHLSASDLLSARWILREKDSGARQRFDQTFSKLLPNLQLYLEFRHNEPIRRAVEQGLGIGCLSEKVLQPFIDDGKLVALKVAPEYRMQRRFFLCLRKHRWHRPAVDDFVDLCLTELAKG